MEPSEHVGTSLMFENERVRVWDFALAPGESLARHVHRLDYFFIVLEGGRLRVDAPNNPAGHRDVEYHTGQVTFIPVAGSKVDERHTNVGDAPYRNLVVELKPSGG